VGATVCLVGTTHNTDIAGPVSRHIQARFQSNPESPLHRLELGGCDMSPFQRAIHIRIQEALTTTPYSPQGPNIHVDHKLVDRVFSPWGVYSWGITVSVQPANKAPEGSPGPLGDTVSGTLNYFLSGKADLTRD
jgi:hypothetical protein